MEQLRQLLRNVALVCVIAQLLPAEHRVERPIRERSNLVVRVLYQLEKHFKRQILIIRKCVLAP